MNACLRGLACTQYSKTGVNGGKEFLQLACILHEGWGDLFFSVGCKRAILQSTNIFPTRKHYA